jgi:hypothetical protein
MAASSLPDGTVRFGYRDYERGAFRETEGFGQVVWAGSVPVAIEVHPDNPRRSPVFIPWPNVLWLVAEH